VEDGEEQVSICLVPMVRHHVVELRLVVSRRVVDEG
jgi:hypothetical protein